MKLEIADVVDLLGRTPATWVVHDWNHVAQIAKAMAYQYREAVGPWRAYLSAMPK